MCHWHIGLTLRHFTSLRSEKSDVHAAAFFKFDFIPSSKMTELCEAISFHNITL